MKNNVQLKLYVFLALPLILLSCLLAYGFYQFDLNARQKLVQTRSENHVQLQANSISLTFEQIISDLKYLSKQQSLIRYLDNPSDSNRQSLANEYLGFSKQKKIYDQVRLLDSQGFEKVRVNYQKSKPFIVANNKLQNKKNRYYFEDSIKLGEGQIFISPFDLNVEKGQIEQPHKPMIRFGMAVFDSQGQKQGIVLLNYLGQHLLDHFRDTASDLIGQLSLLNSDGYSLSSDTPDKDWGFMYADKHLNSFALNHPNIWDKVTEQRSGQFVQQGQLISFNTVVPISASQNINAPSNLTSIELTAQNKRYFWKVISIIPLSDPNFSSSNIKLALLSFTILVTLMSLVGTWALNRARTHLTNSAEQLSAKVKQLEKAQSQLIQSEKMASLGRMVAGFAHEINTPVGIAVGAGSQIETATKELEQLLSQDEVHEEDLFKELDTLNDASRLLLSNLSRAANLIASFKRSSVDQTSNQTRLFSPKEVGEDVLNSLKNKLKRTAIKVELKCLDNIQIFGQAGLLDQLLTNLIINSYIHAFDNGSAPGNIEIEFSLIDSDLYLHYQDNGVGMDEQSLNKIFEPFYTTDRVNGTGLGMYLCYNIVNAELAGSIECKSQVGKGTEFFIRYPVNLKNQARPV